jgi:hypothetical protein
MKRGAAILDFMEMFGLEMILTNLLESIALHVLP